MWWQYSENKTCELSKIEVWLYAEIVEIAKRLHLYKDSSRVLLESTCTYCTYQIKSTLQYQYHLWRPSFGFVGHETQNIKQTGLKLLKLEKDYILSQRTLQELSLGYLGKELVSPTSIRYLVNICCFVNP